MDVRLRNAARGARDELRDLHHPLVSELVDALSEDDDERLLEVCVAVLDELDDLEPSLALARLEGVLYDEDDVETAPAGLADELAVPAAGGLAGGCDGCVLTVDRAAAA